jgi:hypothetical protein
MAVRQGAAETPRTAAALAVLLPLAGAATVRLEPCDAAQLVCATTKIRRRGGHPVRHRS